MDSYMQAHNGQLVHNCRSVVVMIMEYQMIVGVRIVTVIVTLLMKLLVIHFHYLLIDVSLDFLDLLIAVVLLELHLSLLPLLDIPLHFHCPLQSQTMMVINVCYVQTHQLMYANCNMQDVYSLILLVFLLSLQLLDSEV